MAASTSTAADSNNNTRYDVFISHRGPDTKKTIASHLYYRLKDKGLQVFLDYKELQEGEDFPCQIKAAIRAASLHVAIFSPTYADSQWCLDELVFMLESKAPIIPVFHHVKPTALRRTDGEGVYATSLRNLEKKKRKDSQPRYDSETIEKWRNALSRVADISGLDLEACNGNEGELVDKIVEVVRKGVKTPLDGAGYPTGLQEKVQDFETEVLRQQRRGVFGITGLGGVGKTTLSIELFNRKSSEYSKSYFLCDVRENAEKSLHSLQRELLKRLFQFELHMRNRHAGTGELKKCLSSCEVLLVLDDVDHPDQVSALLPPLNDLHRDSLILITSRDKDVLRRSGVQESSIYLLSGLNTQRSRELFCSHAFRNPHPLPEFENLVDDFLKACNGLPLSLKVLGGLLYGHTDKSYWKSKLKALPKKLPGDIQKSLHISYDALEEEEKQIFLDIACFFIGIDRDAAIIVWDGSGWDGKLGFQSLMDKCLVELCMRDKYEAGVKKLQHLIRMHDHLRDMGRDLAKRSGFPCRLWCGTKHMKELLRQSSSEATKVRGIIIMSRWEHYDKRSDTDEDADTDEHYDERSDTDEDADRDEDDERASFSRYKMKNLHILDIQEEEDDDLLKCLLERVHSPKLLYLRWRNCPCSSLPHIPMKKLRVLDVEGSKLKTLWKEDLPIFGVALERLSDSFGHLSRLEHINLSRLEHINLSYCCALERLPDSFGNLSRLQHINLHYCSALERLRDSFGNLSRLQHIDLACCRALERLPDSLGNLSRLQHIDLSCCRALERLPESFGNLSRLEHIDLSCCGALERLPDSFGNLSRLEHIDLSFCDALGRLPDSFGNLIKLEYLSFRGCRELTIPGGTFREINPKHMLFPPWSIKVFPPQIAHQWSLENLLLYLTNLTEWPSATGEACHLERLVLETPFLEALPPSFGNNLRNLKRLELRSCRSLKRLPDSFLMLNQLVDFWVEGCSPELHFKAVEGENETLTDSGGERTSSNLERCLLRLQRLTLRHTEISELSFPTCVFPDLQCLHISDCPDLVEVTLPNALRSLNLYNCSKLRKIGAPFPTGACANLQDLHIMKCKDLVEGTSPNAPKELPNLKMPNASFDYVSIKDLACVLTSRHGLAIEVGISNFSKLRKIGGSFPTGVCPNFQDLRIHHCENLVELEILPTELQHLGIRGCRQLVEVNIRECRQLVEVNLERPLPGLQHLTLRNTRISEVSFPTCVCPDLQYLDISNCPDLVEVTLPNALRSLNLYKCSKLRKIGAPNLQDRHIMKGKDLVEGTLPNAPKELPNFQQCEDPGGVKTLQYAHIVQVIISDFSKLRKIGGSFPTGVCPNFQDLSIQHCENLVELEILPTAIQHLKIRKCDELVEVDCPNLQPLEIWLVDCQELVDVGTLAKAPLKMQLTNCPKMRKIERLCGFTRESRAQRLLNNSTSLFDKCLLRLQHLELHKIPISQVSFPTGACPNLQHLHIRDCEDLIEVRTLPSALIKLQLDRCPKLKLIRIEELAQVMQLREMRVRFCDGLEEMVGVGYLKSLEVMQVSNCVKLKIIQGLEQLTQLRELDFSYCFELEELLGVGHLKSLEVFKATMCRRLKSIRGLEQLTLLRLRELDISYCSELETLS